MSSVALALNKGALEASLFVVSCGIFKLWMNKRTKQNASKIYHQIDNDVYLERIHDPEDSNRRYNIYPEEKIVVRFLH